MLVALSLLSTGTIGGERLAIGEVEDEVVGILAIRSAIGEVEVDVVGTKGKRSAIGEIEDVLVHTSLFHSSSAIGDVKLLIVRIA